MKVVPVFAHVAATLEVCKESLANRHVIRGGIVVEFLMPLLIEVSGRLLDVVSVHDVQNFISHLLAIAGTFPDETEHGSVKILGRKERVSLLLVSGILVLLAKLVGKSDLSVLKLSWLRVVVLLPGQLLRETVSQPDVEKDHMIPVQSVSQA